MTFCQISTFALLLFVVFDPFSFSQPTTVAPGFSNNDTTTNATTTTPYANMSISKPGRPAHNLHALLAGAVGGCLVWGEWSAISHQVLLYISIRALTGFWKLLPIHDHEQWRLTHRIVSTMAWAMVMYLWEASPHVLQSSMRKSMDEIYDSFPEGGFLNGIRPLHRRRTGGSTQRHVHNLSA